MKHRSVFQRVCIHLWLIGAVLGLICGLIHWFWLTMTIDIATNALAVWGIWQTYFVHNNRYELWRWVEMSLNVIAGEIVGYLTGRAICWLIAQLLSMV